MDDDDVGDLSAPAEPLRRLDLDRRRDCDCDCDCDCECGFDGDLEVAGGESGPPTDEERDEGVRGRCCDCDGAGGIIIVVVVGEEGNGG